MPTDNERREVARRLRELAGGYVTIGELESALGICLSSPEVDLERDARDLHRMADLIEPSCDRDALLKVADMLECDGECSECECGKGTFCEAPTIAAARIRKALGVKL